MLLPLQGEWKSVFPIPQGVTLGYVLLGFQPDGLPTNETLPDSNSFKLTKKRYFSLFTQAEAVRK